MMRGIPDTVRQVMEGKPIEELLSIWNNRENGEYSDEALEIVRLILLDRGVETSDVSTTQIRSSVEAIHRPASTGETTRLLCAAAHLHHNSIYEPLRDRFEDPDQLKAETPEYFVDIEAVLAEALIAHRREILRRCLVATIATLGLLTIIAERLELVTLVVGALWLIEFLFDLQRQWYVRARFLRTGASSEAAHVVDTGSMQNVVISGGFSPFVGSGYDIVGWSFVVDLTKPSGEEPPRSLTPTELYDEVTASVSELQIPNLVVSDKLFVHGEELRMDNVILLNVLAKPQVIIPEDHVRQAVGVGLNRARHYRVLQIPAWGGELVLSLFLRFTAVGKGLFVEARFFLLLPLRAEFHTVDNLTQKIKLRQFMGILTVSAFKAPFMWIEALLAGLNAVNRFSEGLRNEQRKLAEDNERFNYGWVRSLREEWSGALYERYFQLLDKDMYSKILQSRIIDAIEVALETRGISTETIKDRGTTILNQGLIVSGGKVEAQSVAVGRRAVAAVQQTIGRNTEGSRPTGRDEKL